MESSARDLIHLNRWKCAEIILNFHWLTDDLVSKMIRLDGNSKVTRISTEPFLLDDFLRSIWKLLRRSGFQHGFLGPMEERRSFYILRCVSTTLIILSVCNLELFQVVILGRVILNTSSINDVVYNVFLSICFIMPVAFLLQLYCGHHGLIEFLRDWKRVETSFDHCRHRDRSGRIVAALRCLFMATVVPALFVMFLGNFIEPTQSFFFSSIPVLRHHFGLHLLAFINTFSYHYAVTLTLLSDMIPAFIFYQAGCMIENLQLEIDNYSANWINSIHPANENPCRCLWKKYESIQKLVDSANQLFGLIMIVNQFCYICLACLSIYRLIEESIDSLAFPIFAACVIIAILRTLGCNWLYFHLPRSCAQFKKSVSALLSEKWHLMPQDHQIYLNCFYNRLNGGELAACPLNLFTIDRSNLLSLLTLHISYTIVLLQSS